MENNELENNLGIEKVLSLNDTGQTGGHQAGILVPKTMLFFFPKLGSDTKNPRVVLRFSDEDGQYWKFNFIYYNNRFFGGTRNEYRLTGMTSYFKQNNLLAQDTIILERSPQNNYQYTIRHLRKELSDDNSGEILILGSTWKVINL